MSSLSQNPDDAIPSLGRVVAGKFRVDEVLGRGGMGVVVRATHLQLGGSVALKFLHGPVARDPAYVERFLREARAAVRVTSEHVARVFDVGMLEDGAPYIVMELLVGDDLHRFARDRGPLPIGEAVDYVVQASRAIAEAHSLSIVHRDLKPANLFVARRSDGSAIVKVLDFGISKTLDGSDQNLTATGDVLGSPLYMSPEQIRDPRGVDARSDIWALGNILYRLLAGRAPFAAETSAATLAKIVADPSPMLRAERPDVPPELEAIVLRCLEKRPENRFQRVDELGAALVAFLDRPSRRSVEPGPSSAPSSSADNRPAARKAMSATMRMDVAPTGMAASNSATYASAVLAASIAQPPASPRASEPGVDSRLTLDPATQATGSSSAVAAGSSSRPGARFALPAVLAIAVSLGAGGAVVMIHFVGGSPRAPAPATAQATEEPLATAAPVPRPLVSPTPSTLVSAAEPSSATVVVRPSVGPTAAPTAIPTPTALSLPGPRKPSTHKPEDAYGQRE